MSSTPALRWTRPVDSSAQAAASSTVVGTGDTLAEARDAAYAKLALIALPGGFHRTDIALKAAAAAASATLPASDLSDSGVAIATPNSDNSGEGAAATSAEGGAR